VFAQRLTPVFPLDCCVAVSRPSAGLPQVISRYDDVEVVFSRCADANSCVCDVDSVTSIQLGIGVQTVGLLLTSGGRCASIHSQLIDLKAAD
jgi:hypothetical protein